MAANGFFVAAEFSLVTVRRTRIEELVQQGHGAARVVRTAIQDLDKYIAGTQIGITLASLALGWIGEPAVATLLQPLLAGLGIAPASSLSHAISIGVGFAVITFLHVILGELVPKSLALQKTEATALIVARPMSLAVFLMRPLIWSLNGLGGHCLKLIGLTPAKEHQDVHSPQELELLVTESHSAGVLDDLAEQMLHRTLRFGQMTVSDVMVARNNMVSLDFNRPTEELLDYAAEAKHNRLPVHSGSLDRIFGVLYVHELFRAGRRRETDLRKIIRTPLFVPVGLRLDKMFEKFRTQRTQIAIVIDEFGASVGMVTLENIVEAVFGEVQDQHEEKKRRFEHASDGTIHMRGETRLLDIAKELDLPVSSTSADTIAGFIMEMLGRVAKAGDVVPVHGGQFIVRRMERFRVLDVEFKPSEIQSGMGEALPERLAGAGAQRSLL